MNYADDRLDRRARFEEDGGANSLWRDFWYALAATPTSNHELLGRTLRDIGWNRHALFHYAIHWYENPHLPRACGDFAQMAEFAGFPEVGVLALLAFRYKQIPCLPWHRNAGDSSSAKPSSWTNGVHCHDESWFLNPPPSVGGCGCGDEHCGKFACFLPLQEGALDAVINDLHVYHRESNPSVRCVPSSGQVLNYQAGKGKLKSLPESDIPLGLKFWKMDENNDPFQSLSPLLQMLLIKLLYVCMPQLACEAVCHVTIPENNTDSTTTTPSQTNLPVVNEKSHRAYFVLTRAVALGRRVKPHRKQLHNPLWDEFWQSATGDPSVAFFDHLKQLTCPVDFPRAQPTTLCWAVPNQMAADPIFLVGDSHVLSLAWQIVEIPAETSRIRRRVIPVVITGLKAWHVRQETRFFTHANLMTILQRLPVHHSRTILLSAGEIDCREGLGGKQLEGYKTKCLDHVKRTVTAFADALLDLSKVVDKEILVLPVAPHGYRKTGRVVSQQSRRETMAAWNEEMRKALPRERVYFLDYVDSLLDPDESGFMLNQMFNADGTHMNSGFGPLLAKAVLDCGCDTSRL